MTFGSGIAALIACLPCLANAVPVDLLEFDLVLKRDPSLAKGAQLYETCAACHGNAGRASVMGAADGLQGSSSLVEKHDRFSRVQNSARSSVISPVIGVLTSSVACI